MIFAEVNTFLNFCMLIKLVNYIADEKENGESVISVIFYNIILQSNKMPTVQQGHRAVCWLHIILKLPYYLKTLS